ncbi:Isoquinoline 1-oxidoreductase subunit [Sphingomonas sp.]|uniref:Isoquinoline 1-oxidoreductase subunit n=1 Tax=Sphingomonas sp. TaxID=28214 RepID=UPI0025D3493E|nr:Isoquinoline 1-oxidoreductase subunit [Sphingomonas sp.]
MMTFPRFGLVMLAASLVVFPLAIARGGIAEGLKPASAFAGIADRNARSAAIFTEMGKVLTSPRCLNCHPRTDSPTQGDAMVVHSPPVRRGPNGFGVAGLECATCHGPRNAKFANGPGTVPGNPKWHLAPRSMAWQGLTLGQICAAIKDPKKNGGMSLAQLIDHNGKDELVGWGWNPGPDRKPAPGSQAAFGELTKAWVDSGAVCPR